MLVKSGGHKFSNCIFFAHEIVIQQQINLVFLAPRHMILYSFQGLLFVKFVRGEESSEYAARKNHLINVIQNFCVVNLLGKLGDLLLLLFSKLIKKTFFEKQKKG